MALSIQHSPRGKLNRNLKKIKIRYKRSEDKEQLENISVIFEKIRFV